MRVLSFGRIKAYPLGEHVIPANIKELDGKTNFSGKLLDVKHAMAPNISQSPEG